MDGISCDRCGEGLLINEDVRYLLSVEIKAAYDPMELTQADLVRNYETEISDILKQLENTSAEDAQRQVYHRGDYDLCGKCQREFLRDPIFRVE